MVLFSRIKIHVSVLMIMLFLGGMFFSPAESQALVENVIKNPGFEDPLGGVIGFGNWNSEPNRGVLQITGGAPEGDRFLRLSEPSTTAAGPPPFIGIFTFQTVAPANPGDIVAFSGLVRVNAAHLADAAQLRIEFQPAGGGPLISAVETSVSSVSSKFNRVSVSAPAPAGTGQVTFVLRIQPSHSGTDGGTMTADFDDMIGTVNDSPIVITAEASKRVVKRGDMTMVAVKIANQGGDKVRGLEVVAKPDRGINIHKGVAGLDDKKVGQYQGSVIFPIGDLDSGQKSTFAFPVIVTSGATPGKIYEIPLRVRTVDEHDDISNGITVTIRVEEDPVFDQGTVIGKVFNDTNQNGVQDKGELGVPWVRIVTEEGIIIITDENGKYHIPAMKVGRHVIKIDGHSLPEGTKFITEESYIIKTTPGIMNKANFAVLLPASGIPEQFKQDLSVMVTQGLDTSRPNLEVVMTPEMLRTGVGVLEKDATFRFSLNYADYVKKWYLEIRDEWGRPVWMGFGVSAPPQDVTWSGQTEQGTLIKPGLYSYQLKVEDQKGNQDWTPLHFFKVVSKTNYNENANRNIEFPTVGDFNIFKDGKQTISLVAKPTIRVQGRTKAGNTVLINNFPVSIDPESGLFQTEMYATPGDKEIIVTSTNPDGETTSFRQKIKVKDSVFFMTALGEEQLGVNFQDGNIETAGQEESFRNGFYQDGRLSYYLKGKIKGKFLIKSHYDTDDKRSGLFRNLDPDDYYPVYGDNSTRDYDAIDTEDRFYFVVEMDRSYAKWGSYQTEFSDTELATYNRTLSGLKVNYETVKTTAYGDPKRGFKLFTATANHRADHNVFASTGGSLFYLRNRRVIEGSEQIRVEVRDKIQDIAVSSRDLVEGRDYEIDYDEGRIILSRPLSAVASTDTLVSQDILDGNPVYLVVDYEHDVGFHADANANRGIRAYTHVGDYLKVGGTAVEEKRQGGDYDLRGVDATLRLGRNTKITAEYAGSQNEQTDQSVSYNGGLSFARLKPLSGEHTHPRETAYLIKGQSQPFKNVEVSGYIQGVEPSFSTENIRSQEGFKKYGLATRFKITDDFYFRYRFDHAEVSDQLMPVEQQGILAPFTLNKNHTAQLVYDDGKYLGELEYRQQNTNFSQGSLSPTLLSEIPLENALAAKLGYHFNDRLLPYVKVQTTIGGKSNNQFGGGVRYQVLNNVFAYIEEMVGNVGDSTYFGIERYHENGARTYTNLKMFDRGIGAKSLATSIGSSFSLTEKSRIFTEREYSDYNSYDGYADILGYDGKLNDHWDYEARYERRHLNGGTTQLLDQVAEDSLGRTNTFNTVSGALAYANGSKFRARISMEVRRDQDATKITQWVTRDSLEYQLTKDLSFLTKLDYGKSFFTGHNDIPADFAEFSTGFAYRPVESDRLNVLTRYTYIRDMANDIQFQNGLFNGLENDETAHIFAVDLAFEVMKYLGMVEKFAYKVVEADTNITEEVSLHNILLAHRFNFHITRKWDVALEYRVLLQSDAAKTLRHGALAEVDREIYDYTRLGVGYNFTDFSDDLRKVNNFDTHGPFVRLTGKF